MSLIPSELIDSLMESLSIIQKAITKPINNREKPLKNIFGSELDFSVDTDICIKKVIGEYLGI